MGLLDVVEVGISVLARGSTNIFRTIAYTALSSNAISSSGCGSDLPVGTQPGNYIRTIKKSQFCG
jgi:hypothetical protein